jgi:hypothetical protein
MEWGDEYGAARDGDGDGCGAAMLEMAMVNGDALLAAREGSSAIFFFVFLS